MTVGIPVTVEWRVKFRQAEAGFGLLTMLIAPEEFKTVLGSGVMMVPVLKGSEWAVTCWCSGELLSMVNGKYFPFMLWIEFCPSLSS